MAWLQAVSLETILKEGEIAYKVHPLVLQLGLKYADGTLKGGNARCIGLLTTFQRVIKVNSSLPVLCRVSISLQPLTVADHVASATTCSAPFCFFCPPPPKNRRTQCPPVLIYILSSPWGRPQYWWVLCCRHVPPEQRLIHWPACSRHCVLATFS